MLGTDDGLRIFCAIQYNEMRAVSFNMLAAVRLSSFAERAAYLALATLFGKRRQVPYLTPVNLGAIGHLSSRRLPLHRHGKKQ